MATHYNISPEESLRDLGSSTSGLSQEEAQKRLQQYGKNEIIKEKGINVWKLFFSQFENFLIILLIVAIVIAAFLGEILEASAMGVIVLINVILGFIQEYRAEKAIDALKKISAPTARVVRNGKEIKIAASEIVPGDIILLEAGDIVPADARIIEQSNLKIDEASLTGESVPSEKFVEAIKGAASVADQENMIFSGTVVSYGNGKAVVTTTGMKTELGKIAHLISVTAETKTPLQVKFEKMAKQIGAAVLILCMIVFLAGIFKEQQSLSTMFFFALSLAVAAVPSALPAIVTISLALGVKDLARQNMIIKKLHAAESLGSVTVICSDKTGTLTKNEMTVTKIYANEKIIDVTGTGYETTGNFVFNKKTINPKEISLLLRAGYLCNNAKLVQKDGKNSIMGDPTEGALIVLGKKSGIDSLDNFSFVKELPFDSERKIMSVVYRNKASRKNEAYVKGAPEMLLDRCTHILINGKVSRLTPSDKKDLLKQNEAFARDAIRVLGVAYKEVRQDDDHKIKSIEKDLIFLGLTGMIDPPHDEVKQAIAECKTAGIRVMMITGDHAITAKAVAKQIGLLEEGDVVLTGDDVEKMSDADLEYQIRTVRIIARALPIQKSRIVDALKKNGHIVAMTGDGVNDAPALKKADIGISMGITGTDVAKQVSKATLVDDNFATIVNAIKEGRNIYDKILKSARYLLSCNTGEILSVFIAVLLNFPLILLPLQILLMNLLTDSAPALGLGMEPSEEDVMRRKPRDPRENPLGGQTLRLIIIFGVLMGLGTVYIFNLYEKTNLPLAQTAAFTTLVLFEMFAVVGSRSLYPLKKLNPFTNRWLWRGILLSVAIQIAVVYWAPLQAVFGTVALGYSEWIKILIVSSLGFVIMESSKFFFNKQEKTGVSQWTSAH